MLTNQKQKEAAKGVFVSSVQLVANVSALAAALLLTGPAFQWLREPNTSYVRTQYGTGFDALTEFTLFCLTAVFIFGVSRATLATAITMGGLAVASRLL